MLNGILLIDKPEGPTSAAVVRRIVRLLPSSKVGHLGTLDPFASGVLPLCVGEGTKIARFLNEADKEYEGVIRLGEAMDTGDRTGRVIRSAEIPDLTEDVLTRVVERFLGSYMQVPPMYSAIKQDGVPLYKLARRGVEVERKARRVEIRELSLVKEGEESLRFRVSCSKGTYVRVLAEDVGSFLGSAAHLETLRRTRFGPFPIADTVPLESWTPESRKGFIPLRQALSHLPAVQLDEQKATAVRRGQGWVLNRLGGLPSAEHAVLLDPGGSVAAVISRRGDDWQFARVLARGSA